MCTGGQEWCCSVQLHVPSVWRWWPTSAPTAGLISDLCPCLCVHVCLFVIHVRVCVGSYMYIQYVFMATPWEAGLVRSYCLSENIHSAFEAVSHKCFTADDEIILMANSVFLASWSVDVCVCVCVWNVCTLYVGHFSATANEDKLTVWSIHIVLDLF